MNKTKQLTVKYWDSLSDGSKRRHATLLSYNEVCGRNATSRKTGERQTVVGNRF